MVPVDGFGGGVPVADGGSAGPGLYPIFPEAAEILRGPRDFSPSADFRVSARRGYWQDCPTDMNGIPSTSTRLLREIAADRQSLRWNDFVGRYRPMMLSFLARRFPALADAADDIVQETLLALMEKLPDYRYDPEELGAFRNYLTGILRNRACKELARRDRHARAHAAAGALAGRDSPGDAADEGATAWRDAVCDIALRQVLSDPALQERTREVFRRTAVEGESPAAVAEAFGMERNAVDQIKNRLLARMRAIVSALAGADGSPEADAESLTAGTASGKGLPGPC